MNINLPNTVSADEDLARVICDSIKPKQYIKFSAEENRYIVKTGAFIDTRYPAILSVNRISTITIDEAHKLGIQHQKEVQQAKTYHGFAGIKAKLCFDNECKIEKEDYGGKKPFHANILYPGDQKKEDDQAIAIKLAQHAEFIKYVQS